MENNQVAQIREGLVCCIGKECDRCPYSGRIYCEDAVREDAAEMLAVLEILRRRLVKSDNEGL